MVTLEPLANCFDWEKVIFTKLGPSQRITESASALREEALSDKDSPEQPEKLEASSRMTRSFQTHQPPRNEALVG